MYDLDLHLDSVILLMEHLNIDGLGPEVSLGVARLRPGRRYPHSIDLD